MSNKPAPPRRQNKSAGPGKRVVHVIVSEDAFIQGKHFALHFNMSWSEYIEHLLLHSAIYLPGKPYEKPRVLDGAET